MDEREISPSEAARRIGTTTRTVQRWIANGSLPARRVGGRWRVAFDALDAFTASVAFRSAHRARRGAGADPPCVRRQSRGDRPAHQPDLPRTGIAVIRSGDDGAGALDLLDGAAVVDAARAAGADAIHPGFGFLAENAAFADTVEAAGLRWIGPPPAAIRAMGDKAAARRLAQSLGVPIVPGYDGADQSDATLGAAAQSIGYPLIVKPAAGGGGKGMRTVRDPGQFEDACASARREASAAFGDDRLVLERLIEGPRHVEIQVLFDAHGHGVHLGERDCSTQRRHQKVIEEAPSPAVGPQLRTELGTAALAVAGAVSYVGAGTCEFLVTDRGEWYFLEMNTRLQVEHPVTELITGRDLVADQLRIAAGEPLGATQVQVDAARARGGHAVEVRLYAEDADAGFLPATGRIERLRWPAGPGIRVDDGIDEGDEVGGQFDPMLAKIIAHGRDRAEALERLTNALGETVVLGLTTNLRFLRWLVRQPAVASGEMRIDTLDRIWPPDGWSAATRAGDDAWAAAAAALGAGGWRLNGPQRIRLVDADGEERSVEVPDDATPTTGETPEVVVARGETERVAHVGVAGRSLAFRVAPPPDVDRAARAAVAHQIGGPVEVRSPMPGSVVAVHVEPGRVVAPGDAIATLDAMKMEHVVVAPAVGRIAELSVRPGDQVARGQVLAIVEP